MLPKIGQQAPSFSLPDQDGKNHTLAQYKGKWVLLYFYPKDDTPGCTVEACSLRDNFPKFGQLDAVVLGVSADAVERHAKFAAKYKLPFTLLADPEKDAVKKYGTWGSKKIFGRSYMGTRRTSFLIDPTGKIAKVYEKVKPAQHAAEVLADIKVLSTK